MMVITIENVLWFARKLNEIQPVQWVLSFYSLFGPINQENEDTSSTDTLNNWNLTRLGSNILS